MVKTDAIALEIQAKLQQETIEVLEERIEILQESLKIHGTTIEHKQQVIQFVEKRTNSLRRSGVGLLEFQRLMFFS